MHGLVMFINRLSRLCGALAAGLIGVSILIVCQMVLLRYGFRASTTWQTDAVTFGLVAATIIGSPYLLHVGGHVGVDLFTRLFSRKTQRWFSLFSSFAVLLIALALAYTGGHLAWEAWEGNWLSETVAEIPLWLPYASMPLGFGLLTLQALADMIALALGYEDALPGQSRSH